MVAKEIMLAMNSEALSFYKLVYKLLAVCFHKLLASISWSIAFATVSLIELNSFPYLRLSKTVKHLRHILPNDELLGWVFRPGEAELFDLTARQTEEPIIRKHVDRHLYIQPSPISITYVQSTAYTIRRRRHFVY